MKQFLFVLPVIEGHFKGIMGAPLKIGTILGAPQNIICNK